MCGIAGYHFFDPENAPMDHMEMENLVTQLLLGIEHRGHDATGVAAVTAAGNLHIEKADLAASRFDLWRKDIPEKPQSVLLHTRYATQGSPMNLNNNHPIRYNNVVAIHNGHISNDSEIFELEALTRNAQVDSECIAALFDKYGVEKAHIPLGKLDGNFAIAVVDLRKPNVLCLAKGFQSPLFYYKNKHGIIWASTEKTIKDAMALVFDIDLKFKDIEQLGFGSILYIEDGEVERLGFKSYQKPWAVTPNRTYYEGQQWQWDNEVEYEDVKEEEKEESCVTTFAKMFSRGKSFAKKTGHSNHPSYDSETDHVDFWEKEPHPISYRIPTGKGVLLFKQCDDCEVNTSTTALNLTEEGFIFCDTCYRVFMATLDSKDKNEGQEILNDENPAVVHDIIIETIAEHYKTTTGFVHWLLFDSDESDIGNTPDLLSSYVQFDDDYNRLHDALTGEPFGSSRYAALIEDTEEDDCGVQVFEDSAIEASTV